MKHHLKITSLFSVLMLMLLCLSPVYAQDSAATGEATSTFTYVAYAGLVLVAIALIFNITALLKLVAPLVPLETALEIIKAGAPTAADLVLNEAASKTPTLLDDKLLIAALRAKGYTVTGTPGDYHTSPTIPISGNGGVSSAVIYTSTLSTDDPTRTPPQG